jgi:hypothetical protein
VHKCVHADGVYIYSIYIIYLFSTSVQTRPVSARTDFFFSASAPAGPASRWAPLDPRRRGLRPSGRTPASERMLPSRRMHTCIYADRARVRADAAIYPLDNFKTDATVHLSHGRPNSHRPRARPSICPLDNPAWAWAGPGPWGILFFTFKFYLF